jgi:hypothetical protein
MKANAALRRVRRWLEKRQQLLIQVAQGAVVKQKRFVDLR